MKKFASTVLCLAVTAASVWNITKVLPGISLAGMGLGEIAVILGTMAVAFFILMGYLRDEVSPAVLTPVWLLWSFPIIRLAVYVCLMMFRNGKPGDPAAQTRWEWIGIAVVYVVVLVIYIPNLKNTMARRERASRGFVPQTKESVGPDGNTYLLPANTETGWWILYGYERPRQKENAEKVAIKNQLHRLLWQTEFCELVYCQGKPFVVNIFDIDGERQFERVYTRLWVYVAELWEGKPVYNDDTLVFQCPREYVDMKKAVHFYEMAADVAYEALWHDYLSLEANGLFANGVGPWAKNRDRDLKQMQKICGRLIEIYRGGVPGVPPSEEKVKYYRDFFEKYKKEREKDVKFAQDNLKRRQEKEQQERDRVGVTAQSRETYRSTPSSSEVSFDTEPQTAFSFPAFLYDYDENPWELISSGYDNATYYCQKTGETTMFYQSDFDIGSPSGFHRR